MPYDNGCDSEEFYDNIFWDAYIWSSGDDKWTGYLPDGFHVNLRSKIPDILNAAGSMKGHSARRITGGWETDCHGSNSLHYSGKALDIGGRDWIGDTNARNEFMNYVRSLGLSCAWHNNHFHISYIGEGDQ